MSKNLIINLCLSTCYVNNIRLFCFLTFLQNEKKLITAYLRWVSRLKQKSFRKTISKLSIKFLYRDLELTCKGGFPSNSTIWLSSTSSYNTAFVFLDTYIYILLFIIRKASQFLYLLMTILKLFQISRSSSVNKNGSTFLYIIYISLKHNWEYIVLEIKV